MKDKNKQLIESLELKINSLKEIKTTTNDVYTGGKIQGMIDGFEYALDKIKQLPIWVPITEKALYILLGILIGFIIGMLITINYHL